MSFGMNLATDRAVKGGLASEFLGMSDAVRTSAKQPSQSLVNFSDRSSSSSLSRSVDSSLEPRRLDGDVLGDRGQAPQADHGLAITPFDIGHTRPDWLSNAHTSSMVGSKSDGMALVNQQGSFPPAYAQHRPYSYPMPGPAGPGPVLSNVHSPSMVGAMPHDMIPHFNSGHAAQMHHLYGHYQAPNPQNDRPFRCDQCPQSFNRNHDLKRHKRIHVTVKPFPCGHCDKSFSRKDALKRHVLVKGCGKAGVVAAEVEELDGYQSPGARSESVEPNPVTDGYQSPEAKSESLGLSPVINECESDSTTSVPATSQAAQAGIETRPMDVDKIVRGLRARLDRLRKYILSAQSGWNSTLPNNGISRANSTPPSHRSGCESILCKSSTPASAEPDGVSHLANSDDTTVSDQDSCTHEDRMRTSKRSHSASPSMFRGLYGAYFSHGHEQGQSSTTNVDTSRTAATHPRSSGKRKASDRNDKRRRTRSESRDDDEGRPARRWRRDPPSDTDGSTSARLRCIFHVGEPHIYSSHTKRYLYISQLLRHLKSHNFFACSKCFNKFETEEEKEAHEHRRASKSCADIRCLRYLQQSDGPSTDCAHIFSADHQWRELFRMQYPNLEPDVEAASGSLSAASAMPNQMAEEADYEMFRELAGLASSAIPLDLDQSWSLDQPLDTLESVADEGGVPGRDVTGINDYAPIEQQQHNPLDTILGDDSDLFAQPTQADPVTSNEIRTMQRQIYLLEQCLLPTATPAMPTMPSQREQDLELALDNVWQALARTSSGDAQPGSAVWKVVRRFAPNILRDSSSAADSGYGSGL